MLVQCQLPELMKKTIYYCDWCQLQSRIEDCIPCEWSTTTGDILCSLCNLEREKAIRAAFDIRRDINKGQISAVRE